MNQKYIAISILLGSLLISSSILLKDFSKENNTNTNNVVSAEENVFVSGNVSREVNQNLYGNENAEITIVEFSDFECPFCARLHPTLKRIVDESEGKIAWEYRHLPLPNHKNAFLGAVASECVARELGTEGFFTFADILFANIGSHSREFFKDEAQKLGVDLNIFENCLNDESIAEVVRNDSDTAGSLGGNGTPFSIITTAEGTGTVVSGAQPYTEWMRIINSL